MYSFINGLKSWKASNNLRFMGKSRDSYKFSCMSVRINSSYMEERPEQGIRTISEQSGELGNAESGGCWDHEVLHFY